MDEIRAFYHFFPTLVFFGRSTLPVDDLLCHDWFYIPALMAFETPLYKSEQAGMNRTT
jgi:hypothetical protein